MLTWLRGLGLLRHPELVRDLGERYRHLQQWAEVARAFPTSKLDRDTLLVGWAPGRLTVGEQATIGRGTVLAFGDELNGYGHVSIGPRTWVGQYNNFRAGGGDIEIGADCLISQFCSLVASNHGTARDTCIRGQVPEAGRRGVVLHDDVWLGAGVVITPGITIHRGAVLGANAVVTTDIPEYEIWAGVPARKIGVRK